MLEWLQLIGLAPRGQTPKPLAEAETAKKILAVLRPEHVGLCRGVNYTVGTCSGRVFDVVNPTADQVSIEEIAHALAQINRFGGHAKFPYSVAQHAVHCAQECLRRYPGRFDWAFALLHHDDAECYLGDVVRGVKRLIEAAYRPLETKVQNSIWNHLGVTIDAACQAAIHEIDNAVCMAEAAVLMIGSEKWNWGATKAAAIEVKERCWTADRERFLQAYRNLDAARIGGWPSTLPFSGN